MATSRAHGGDRQWPGTPMCWMGTYLGPATRPCTRIGTSNWVECWAEWSSTDICKLCMNLCAFYLLLCSNHTNPNLFKYFSKIRLDSVSLVSLFTIISWPVLPSLSFSMHLLAAYLSRSPTLLLERPRHVFFLLLLLTVTAIYVARDVMFTLNTVSQSNIFLDLPSFRCILI